MSKVIAFSGGCFSGKTTAAFVIKSYLENAGYKVVVLDELIRTATDKPIDEIRKNPAEYLKLQETIIRGKIEQEIKAFADTSDVVYLADRAITDSLFYLQNYVDKSSLNDEEIIRFCNLHKDVIQHAKYAFSDFGYLSVIEFKPLRGENTDKFRPKHIDHSKEYEHDAIRTLNLSFQSYSSVPFIKYVDMNVEDVYELAMSVIKNLKFQRWQGTLNI